MKVLTTNIFIHGKPLKKLQSLGYNGTNCQFRIICGCTSRSEANKQWKSITGNSKVFEGNQTRETADLTELTIAENGGCYICINGTNGSGYVRADEIYS